jgi:hypothetical protein
MALVVASTLTWAVAGPSGTAQAATACTAGLCVLDSSAADALNVHPGIVQVTGDVLVNSTASEAARVSGAASVTATGTIGGPAAPAGFATSGGGTYSPTPTNKAAGTDPYASLAQCPSATACPTTPVPPFPSVNHIAGSQTINPGVYSSITSSGGTLTLNPGTYVVTTKLTVSGGHLTGSGVTIYLACLTYPVACAVPTSGAFYTAQSGAVVTLTSPSSGDYAGLTFFADRNNTAAITTTGTGVSTTADAVYAASGKLAVASGGTAGFTRAVVGTVEVTSNSHLTVIPATGVLSISVPATAGLGSAAPGGTLSAALGSVTVSDQRGQSNASWTASVASTGFTTGGGGTSAEVATTQVSYWSGPATATTGTATTTPGQANAAVAQVLTSSRTAFSSTGGTGSTSATWNPTLVVMVPAAAVGGTYTATVTHSVL